MSNDKNGNNDNNNNNNNNNNNSNSNINNNNNNNNKYVRFQVDEPVKNAIEINKFTQDLKKVSVTGKLLHYTDF